MAATEATRSQRSFNSAETNPAEEQDWTSLRLAVQIGTRTSFMQAGQIGTSSRRVVQVKTSFRYSTPRQKSTKV